MSIQYFELDVANVEQIDVTILNTNTNRKIVQRLQVDEDGHFCADGDYHIGGVKGTASQIKVTFVEPAGSMTNQLFPSGHRREEITVNSSIGEFTVAASMVDAANPFVFVDETTMPTAWNTLDRLDGTSLSVIEAIRCAAAVRMGLAVDEKSAHLVRGTPKIALLSPSKSTNVFADNSKHTADIHVNSYSMGKPHPSFQLTGAVCLGAATSIPGTIASDIRERAKLLTPPGTPPQETLDGGLLAESTLGRRTVTIEHSSGEIEAEVNLGKNSDGKITVEGVAVSRTARRLFEGNVLLRM